MKKIVQLSILLLAYNIACSQAGKFDSTFSNNGKVITKFDKPASLRAIALQSDGKIVVAGTINGNFTLVRYNTDGSKDKSFGNNGIVKGRRGNARSVVIQDNGRIVVAGYTPMLRGFKTHYKITVARYTIHGDVDSSFGEDGSVIIDDRNYDFCVAAAIQKDGKIVLAGRSSNGSYLPKVFLARLNTDGSYDTNFGDSGTKVEAADDFGWTINFFVITTMALQSDGKIIVGGYGYDANGFDIMHTVLMRFEVTGHLDKSFGYKGRASFSGIEIYHIAVQSDDKIVCVGHGQKLHREEFYHYYTDVPYLSRYTKDGFIDYTYGSNGYVSVLPYESDRVAYVYSVAMLPNDESVSTMQYSGASDTTLAILKYNTAGQRDSTFNGDGKKYLLIQI